MSVQIKFVSLLSLLGLLIPRPDSVSGEPETGELLQQRLELEKLRKEVNDLKRAVANRMYYKLH